MTNNLNISFDHDRNAIFSDDTFRFQRGNKFLFSINNGGIESNRLMQKLSVLMSDSRQKLRFHLKFDTDWNAEHDSGSRYHIGFIIIGWHTRKKLEFKRKIKI